MSTELGAEIVDPDELEKSLEQFRRLKASIELTVEMYWPPGSRVYPSGCRSDWWIASTGDIRGDEVFCTFDNGAGFYVPFDQLSR